MISQDLSVNSIKCNSNVNFTLPSSKHLGMSIKASITVGSCWLGWLVTYSSKVISLRWLVVLAQCLAYMWATVLYCPKKSALLNELSTLCSATKHVVNKAWLTSCQLSWLVKVCYMTFKSTNFPLMSLMQSSIKS